MTVQSVQRGLHNQMKIGPFKPKNRSVLKVPRFVNVF